MGGLGAAGLPGLADEPFEHSLLASKALDQWAYENGVRLHFIDPGKPQQNVRLRLIQLAVQGRVPQRTLVPQSG